MIAVYDSGYGGLSVLRAFRALLPQQDFLYLGDNGRAPYGGRDAHTILDFAEQCTGYLLEIGCPLVVVACHTVSCVALRHLQQHFQGSHVLGVTIPAAEATVQQSKGHVGFLGTARTVASGTFAVEMAKLSPEFKVSMVAAPLLAPIVEEGLLSDPIARLAVRRYVGMLPEVDTVVLGCTHYPLLKRIFLEELPAGVQLLDPSEFIALRLKDWLHRHPSVSPDGNGTLQVHSSGDPEQMQRLGAMFLGEALPPVEHVAEEYGRLKAREHLILPGQLTRGRHVL